MPWSRSDPTPLRNPQLLRTVVENHSRSVYSQLTFTSLLTLNPSFQLYDSALAGE